MDSENIRAFTRLIEYRNFSKTADELCISQSALSHRINVLEEELGVKLILRSRGRHNFELTAAGTKFVAIAKRWSSLNAEIENFQKSTFHESLSVASLDTINNLMFPLFERIIDEEPFLVKQYVFNSSAHIISEVNSQSIDVGLECHESSFRNVIARPLFRERYYIAGLLYTDKSVIDPRTLNPHMELKTTWNTAYSQWYDTFFTSKERPLVEIHSISSLTHYMKGERWAIVPSSVAIYLKHNAHLLSDKTIQIYQMTSQPPVRVCYEVTSQFPKASRIDAIHRFEARMLDFIREIKLEL